MGLFDKLTGTRYPDSGIAPRSAADLRAALLDLNQPDNPWVVRNATTKGVDLVAEWRTREPAWQAFFVQHRLSREVQISHAPGRRRPCGARCRPAVGGHLGR
ncbi:hypothetical protein [Streptomyces sclerotialus]|uniref:hypothetical protein n=1 Tax=Streptomyces sclerotialus TaxID=1957 RepID=UPI000A6F9F3E